MRIRIGIGLGVIPPSARPVATSAPVNVVAPSVTGILTQGQTLTADPGAWTGLPSGSFDYQWQRWNGASWVNIAGATAATRLLDANDVAAGANGLRVAVTATNEIGSTTAFSAAVTIAAPLTISGTPGAATVGTPYSFVPSKAGGHDPSTFALTGTLPAGLGFNTATGEISGTPTTSGDAAGLNITVTDANGLTAALGVFTLSVSAGGSSAPGVAKTTLPALSTATVRAHYHAGASVTTLDGSGRVTQIEDLSGAANHAVATVAAGFNGPTLRQDKRGRKFLDFSRNQFMLGPTSVGAISTRAFALFMVIRVPNLMAGTNPFLSFGRNDLGTGLNSNGAPAAAISSASAVPTLRATSVGSLSATANVANTVPGAQLQVIGIVSRAAANGGVRFYHNNVAAPVATTTLAFSATSAAGSGFEIMRSSQSAPTANSCGNGLVYEYVFVQGEMTNAEADAFAAAMVSNFSIAAVTNRLVLEGDSIEFGWPSNTPPVAPYQNAAIVMSEQGDANALDGSWSVVSLATSGAFMLAGSVLVTRKNATNGWPTLKLSGKNILAYQIGINDMPSGTAADVRAAEVAYLHNTTSGQEGVFQRGWDVVRGINIGTGNTGNQAKLVTLRAMLRDPAFTADTLTASGAAQELGFANLDLIAVGGTKIWEVSSDLNNTYVQTDNIHPTPAGTIEMMLNANGFVPAIKALAA